MARKSQDEVTLIGRQKHVDAINKNGLHVTGVRGDFLIKNIKATTDIKSIGNADLIFITTKAYDTKEAISSATDMIRSDTMIISLQNGLGTEQVIQENITKTNKIFRITTTNGALMKEPGHVIHTGFGSTILGGVFKGQVKEIDIIKNLLDTSGFEIEITDDIKSLIWKKIMVNVGINPLGTLLNVTNGMIPKRISDKMLKKILKEAIIVAEKEGVPITLEEAYDSVITVCNMTKNNRNSMLQDIDKGKRTEIDYINGAIVTLARKYDIEVPYNELITALIKGKENKS